MAEENFIMFETFDFDHNESFQAGWNVISKSIDSAQMAAAYVRAKAFFFNKNVARMDYEQYIMWKHNIFSYSGQYKQNGNVTFERSSSPNNPVKSLEVNNSHCYVEIPTNLTQVSETHGMEQCVTLDESSEDRPMSQVVQETESSLSLSDLAELLQNNKPVPGLRSLNIQPSNAEPTPSTMSRRLKPWETTTSKPDFVLPLDKKSFSARDTENVQTL